MPAAAVPLAVVGFGIQAYSQYEAGQANAAAARRNAFLAGAAADDALQRGVQRAMFRRMAGVRRTAAQTVQFAHAGVDVSSGTPAATISQTAMISELDAKVQENNAYREALGYRRQATAFRSQAADLERAGMLNAIGSLIGGAGKIAGAAGASPSTGGQEDFSGFGGPGEPP